MHRLIPTALIALSLATSAIAQPAAPATEAAFFKPVTEVKDGALQVVFGERALVTIAADGVPVLEKIEKGELAVAHATGKVKETFRPPGAGKLAIALDGSAEKRTSYLKIWNGYDYPVIYRAGILALRQGKLQPVTVRVCAVPGGETRYESWPRPVVAVALGNFRKADKADACN